MKQILWPIAIIVLAVSIFLSAHLAQPRAYSGEASALVVSGDGFWVLSGGAVYFCNLNHRPNAVWSRWDIPK